MHLVLVNPGEPLRKLAQNSVVRLTDRLNMTIVVDWDVKPQIKQTKEIGLAQKKRNEPCHEKTCLRSLRLGKTQTGLPTETNYSLEI